MLEETAVELGPAEASLAARALDECLGAGSVPEHRGEEARELRDRLMVERTWHEAMRCSPGDEVRVSTKGQAYQGRVKRVERCPEPAVAVPVDRRLVVEAGEGYADYDFWLDMDPSGRLRVYDPRRDASMLAGSAEVGP
jgi:hypothetical protein